MLKLSQISKHYGGNAVVNQVDLSIAAGESVAVIGHNGAGKTTLMKLVLGLVKPSSGTLEVDNNSADSVQANIGFLPETVTFQGEMTGIQILRFYARLKQVGLKQCNELLELVGLTQAAINRVKTYSKGMRQRLGLAQALLGTPKLLLLDEPTTGLDPFLRQHFYRIILDCKLRGTAILISSHALSEIEGEIDKILIMKQGSVLAQGTLEQLREEAGLLVRINVITRPGQEHNFKHFHGESPYSKNSEEGGSGCFAFQCSQDEKIVLMEQIMVKHEYIQDIQIIPPRLDDLYSYFVNKADA